MTLRKPGDQWSTRSQLLIFLAILVAFRLASVSVLPIVQDEAYYFNWSRHLAWGYLDHPPLTALLGWTSTLSTTPIMSRAAAALLGLAFIPLSLSLIRKCLADEKWHLPAFLLLNFNLLGLLFSALVTPDLPLIVCWTIALHELIAVMKGNHQRWITLGAAIGVGFLGKYIMILFALVVAWIVFRHHRQTLRTPWPYLGAICAFVIVLPHLVWNAQNDFATMQFLAKRGIVKQYSDGQTVHHPLPAPELALPGSQEFLLAEHMRQALPTDLMEERPHRPRSAWARITKPFSDFVGSQLLLWSWQLLVILPCLYMGWRKGQSIPIAAEVRRVLVAGTVVPLAFFGALALFTKVEGNWAAPYAISASLLLAPMVSRPRWLMTSSLVNVFFLLVALVHAHYPLPFREAGRDRLLAETAGFAELANAISTYDSKPVFAETYQLTAMLNYYRPDIRAQQWPGLTRPSEFTRNPAFWNIDHDSKNEMQHFLIVGNNLPPPQIPGFTAQSLYEMRACLTSQFYVTKASPDLQSLPCLQQTVQRWYVTSYQRN